MATDIYHNSGPMPDRGFNVKAEERVYAGQVAAKGPNREKGLTTPKSPDDYQVLARKRRRRE
jgi:hypothetical protein